MAVLDKLQKLKDLPPWNHKPRPMHLRIISGVVGAVVFSTLIFYGNGLAFFLGVAILSIAGANELYAAARRQDDEPNEVWGFIACIVFQYAAWTNNGRNVAPFLQAGLLFLVAATMLTELAKRKLNPIRNVGITLLGAIYVGWMLSYLTLLHGLTTPHVSPPIHGTTSGQWLVVFVATATWFSDIGALYTGIWLGRRKLAPAISPAKTWEGSAGGILFSLAGGAALGHVLHMPLAHALVLAGLCGVFGQLGDLCESIFKRDLRVKDFGNVIPGHGGVLDRIDSLLFTTPLAYYYVVLVMMR